MRRLLLALLLLSGPAWADSGMMMGGVSNRQMPLDPVAAASDCYSWRRLRTAYTAGKAYNIVRASDSTTSDIGFRADGSPDTATLATFCNATTCKLVTKYDQCGALNITQATDASRPPLTLAGLGIYPYFSTTSGSISLNSSSNLTPATGIVSLAFVGRRSVGTGTSQFLRENGAGNRIQARSATTGLSLNGGTSGTVTTSSAENTWHAVNAVIGSGTNNSKINVDGVVNGGTTVGSTTAGTVTIIGAASTTCDEIEEVIWDNYSRTEDEANYLINNPRASWGF